MNTPCRRTMIAACTIAVAITLLPGCTTGRKALHAADFLPPTPHYDDATQWYITDRHADAGSQRSCRCFNTGSFLCTWMSLQTAVNLSQRF